MDSIRWILDLISAGVRIVQLDPWEQVYDSEMDERTLVQMLMELSRGHGESRRKGMLVGNAWESRKQAAREGKPMKNRGPAWVRFDGTRYVLLPKQAATVKKIFDLSCSGLGITTIVRRLVADGVKPLTATGWNRGYIANLLRTRAALGEYQPMKREGGRKVPDGAPIPDYYRAAITETLWAAAQQAKSARMRKSGRPARGGGPSSPFAGLLWSAIDGSKLNPSNNGRRKILVSRAYLDGRVSLERRYFPLEHLADALLSSLEREEVGGLFPGQGTAAVDRLDQLLKDCRQRLRVAMERHRADPYSPLWADEATVCEREERELRVQHRDAVRLAETPLSQTWLDTVAFMGRNEPARLRQGLLSTIAKIWCVFVRKHPFRLAAVQVCFRDSAARRAYLIWSYYPNGRRAQKEESKWGVLSWMDEVGGDLDLSDPKQAAALEQALLKRPLAIPVQVKPGRGK